MMAYDLLLTAFGSYAALEDGNDPFLAQARLRTLEMLFKLKAILKPKETITLNDLEQLLLDEPFYRTSYQHACQYLTARYHAGEFYNDEFWPG